MEPEDRSDDSRIRRRRLLALSGALLGSLAGCSGGGGGGGDGTPETDSPTETAADDTDAPTDSPTPTAKSDRTPFPTPTPGSAVSLSEPFGSESPSSEIAPADGFATLDWTSDLGLQVVKVTNLDSEGEGSLRWAVRKREPTLVVFEVGGVIDLQGDGITIPGVAANTFVAGQTAPPPGITVIRGGIHVNVHNVFIQHIRVRPGDRLVEGPREGPAKGSPTDSMSVASGVSNVAFDHCSASWSSDENMSTGGGFRNFEITFSNNIIAEGLSESVHPKGSHPYGSLIMNEASDVAVIGNIYSDNVARNPRLKGGTSSVVVNNVAYNFSRAVMMGGDTGTPAVSSIVGNHYLAGPVTDTGDYLVFPRDDAVDPEVYLADNTSEPEMTVAHPRVKQLEERPLWPEGLEAIPAADVMDHNFAAAGARPADRSLHDQRILSETRNNNGAIIDSQDQVGGYPELEGTTRELDVPDGNVGEWLRQHTRAVELPDAEPP